MQMHSLVRYGDLAAVQRRLNGKPLNKDQHEGTVLLNIAATSRFAGVDMLQLLIEYGANPDPLESSSLSIAAKSGSLKRYAICCKSARIPTSAIRTATHR